MTVDDSNDNQQPDAPSHYVAIGTSAGGLEALQNFLQHTPDNSGLAFIVIQHLSPHFKSVMDELLTKHTRMPVLVATDNQRVIANRIYLIPPNKAMTISNGHLLLEELKKDGLVNFSIDTFFHSLAKDQQQHSIAVILSGTGSDGSRGIQSIKDEGGLVLIQEPGDAKFDGMPQRAQQTGLADVVAPATQIPGYIIQAISNQLSAGQHNSLLDQIEQSTEALEDIHQLIKQHQGIDFNHYKVSTVARRIERRICLAGLSNLWDYRDLLLANSAELEALTKSMLINVTRFFRDDAAFNYLADEVIPKLLQRQDDGSPIRIWVAGCSTGEEAYSVAILLDEAMRQHNQSVPIKIFATDVDAEAITIASTGQFHQSISDDLSEARLARYFTRCQIGYTVVPELRQMVIFATHNLIKDPPFSKCQLTLCRNVLIYFQPQIQRRILSLLHFATEDAGFLFLGQSENLGDLRSAFTVVEEHHRIYCKKPTHQSLHPNTFITQSSNTKLGKQHSPSLERLMQNYQKQNKPASYMPALEALLSEYVPACILINQDMEVLHIYGDLTPFTQKLKAGRFSANVQDFIVEDLNIAVTTALHRALKEKKPVQYNNVGYASSDGTQSRIGIKAMYFAGNNTTDPHLALVFENSTPPVSREIPEDTNIEDISKQRIQDLERALQTYREDLQAAIEERETTNEELQSSNEELMASNEELQSTNEELQSVNEELYSVNSEYQDKISELTQVTLDLDNIIKSGEIGFIFLDDAMLIRRFSPLAAQTVNLIDSDLGRPFHHISHSLQYSGFLEDISFVIHEERVIEKEIKSQQGEPIWVKISPYYDERGTAMGCVISLMDISELTTLKSRLQDSYLQLRATIEAAFWQQNTKVKLLVVDDNTVDRMTLSSALRSAGRKGVEYDIAEADSFESATKILENKEFDVCLVDVRLGAHTGFELIERLNQVANPPAFIVVSGQFDDQMSESAIKLGVYDMIDKKDISAPLLERSIRYTQRHKQTELYLSQKIDDKTSSRN